jgi:arylsulfatase A-like enzyme
MPPPSVRAVLCTGAVTSLVAGAAAGVIDGLWSWEPASQFVPDAGGKLRLLVYLAAAYGLVAVWIGTLATLIGLFYMRLTRLGDLARHAAAEHERARARGPQHAVGGLSLAIIGVLQVLGWLVIAYWLADHHLATRKNYHLVIAVAMAATIAAIAIAVLITFAVGRLIELVLAALAEYPALGPTLSSPRAPVVAVAVVVAIYGAIGVAVAWPTLRLLHLRPAAVAGLVLVLAAGFWPAGRRVAARLTRHSLGKLAAGWVGLELVLALLVLLTGNRLAVVKAAFAYSGAGGPIARGVRVVGDLDGDGFSRFLGGGDCDDGAVDVHPGATDIPDDGVDQNCVGGDATIRHSADEVAFATPPASLPDDFDIVLITIDTLRADHLGTYGYGRDTSPHLDELAADSTVFVNGWAHAPSTRYSMPAIITGRYPLDVRYDTSVQGWPGLLPRATTIAELLAPLGFTTAAILNHWYFDRSRHFDQGFAHYDDANARLHPGVPGKGPAETRGSSSKEQTDSAIAWLDTVPGKRVFLWVHYYDPHFAYERHDGIDFGNRPIDLYDGEIRYTDDHVGRLLDDLKRRGRWDHTVVVVTGDHGEGFGEHDVEQHGYHLYGAQTKVPLLIHIPGQPGRRVTMPAGHVDILPTLVNLAGGAPSTEMMGRSLVDVLAGAPDRDREVFQQLSYEGAHEMRAAASQQCHVIYNVSPVSSWEVYRIDRDPAETRDAVDDPGPCAEVQGALGRWYDAEQVPADAAEALLSGPPDVAAPLDVDFGSEVRLLSIELPRQVRAGEALDVTWTFEALGRLRGGWQVFAHFVDDKGKTGFQGDHVPAWPFEWWKRGQYIRYTRTVIVPRQARPGTYHLWAGVWKGKLRRKVRGEIPVDNDAADVATVEVIR